MTLAGPLACATCTQSAPHRPPPPALLRRRRTRCTSRRLCAHAATTLLHWHVRELSIRVRSPIKGCLPSSCGAHTAASARHCRRHRAPFPAYFLDCLTPWEASLDLVGAPSLICCWEPPRSPLDFEPRQTRRLCASPTLTELSPSPLPPPIAPQWPNLPPVLLVCQLRSPLTNGELTCVAEGCCVNSRFSQGLGSKVRG
jgi:hypothetical protein